MEEAAHALSEPSPWVQRWAGSVARGPVLDLACGAGRHARYFARLGFDVVAVDVAPQRFASPRIRFVHADLEQGPWPLGPQRFAAVVVIQYLHRPLFPRIRAALAPDGVLLYETFMVGHERHGRPSNPAFLLRPGELLGAFRGLRVLAFEQGEQRIPRPAVVQRLCARREQE